MSKCTASNQFERCWFGANPEQLRLLSQWLAEHQVEEVVMQSNRGPRGRKKDFRDAERLVKRLVADELKLSFVPDREQRLWRTLTRRRYQLTRARVQLQNQLEALLEEAHLKLSSLVSDLLGC